MAARGHTKSARFFPRLWESKTDGLGRIERMVILDVLVFNWDKRTPMPAALFELECDKATFAILDGLVVSGHMFLSDEGYWAALATRMSIGHRYGRLNKNEWEPIRKRIFERDSYICRYCGSRGYLECDHVLPLSRGGDNQDQNLVTACRPCNRMKRDRTPEEMGWIIQ